jgi:plastocyanin
MKAALATLLVLGGLSSLLAHAGSITGTVSAEGKPEAQAQAGDGGAYDSRKLKFAEKVNYSELHDFIVYIEGPLVTNVDASKLTATVETHRITQKGALFSPHVLPVLVGTTVEWPNNDDIYHNVFSMSDTKPFDLGLYMHPEVKKITFDKPGRVDVFCSIHSRMNCIVLVLQNPWYAAADAGGRYRIPNVPAGKYILKAWHERVPAETKEITVPADGEVRVDFTLGINHLPKY